MILVDLVVVLVPQPVDEAELQGGDQDGHGRRQQRAVEPHAKVEIKHDLFSHFSAIFRCRFNCCCFDVKPAQGGNVAG